MIDRWDELKETSVHGMDRLINGIYQCTPVFNQQINGKDRLEGSGRGDTLQKLGIHESLIGFRNLEKFGGVVMGKQNKKNDEGERV